MTCIVGVVHSLGVTIGGDSAGVSGLDLVVRKDPKVFTVAGGSLVLGFTSSFRMGDLLRYRLEVPKRHMDVELDRWIRTDFIDAVRACLKNGGFAEVSNGVERGGTFLCGVGGRLFTVSSDFQVGEAASGFDACGCGESFALGALHALDGDAGGALPSREEAELRVRRALAVAETCSAGVRGPFAVATAMSLTIAVAPPFAG